MIWIDKLPTGEAVPAEISDPLNRMTVRRKFKLALPSGTLTLGVRTLVMGVLNVTPDSFSDGGKFYTNEHAIAQALRIEREGADLLDIGAESTRPGSAGVTIEEELRRLLPVLGSVRRLLKIPISIDTQKAEVAEAAIKAGAQIINDVSGLRGDTRIAAVAARHGVPLILMHRRGEPRTMQKGPFARDVMKDVTAGLQRSVALAVKAGVRKAQIILDPGIGFGKNYQQNYELLQKLAQFGKMGFPLLVGTSRKAFLGATLARNGKPLPPEERIWATAATVTASILHGAHIVRVHDALEMVQVARVADCCLAHARRAQGKK
ncbi:MAG TPA: dihydropteroate synthase [Candidatus Saccharimonadales bacterium]|nr:dihydropteroate synthase [Candidatus Saccharimonadales bacterium]